MPDDGTTACPECEAKVILNGGVSARVLDETCKTIYQHLEKGGTFEGVKGLVERANDIEDRVFRFQRAVLESIGFRGPWPHSLTVKD